MRFLKKYQGEIICRRQYPVEQKLAPLAREISCSNKVINSAMLACKKSGFDVGDHFPDIRKMIAMASR